jgi:predicted amidophosphoribosyltransferase
MVFKDDSKIQRHGHIASLGDYHPYYKEDGIEKNPEFNRYGKMILDLKSNNFRAIQYFFSFLNEVINPDVAIAVVPPHTAKNIETGIGKLALMLARQNRINAVHCLKRIEEIPKQSRGGERKRELHLKTIEIIQPEIILEKPVLLLDDISTTSNSLIACREILTVSRAKLVQCLALGITVR